MKTGLRNTGIEILGDVPWGTHLCQFYRTRQDLTDILVPYFKAGLENNEFCMWITSEPLGVEAAIEEMRMAMPDFNGYLEKGQIEIIPHTEWYLKGGVFDSGRVLGDWVKKLEAALENGFAGLRLTGNTFWLEKKDWDDFTNYEHEVDVAIGSYNMLAICTYSLDVCGASEILDVVSNHRFALARRGGLWSLIESAGLKRAEYLLDEAESRYRTLVEQSPYGIVVIDPESASIVEFNDAACRHLGYSRLEFAALKLCDYEADETAERGLSRLKGILERGGGEFETRHRTRGGELRDVQVSAKVLKTSARTYVYCIHRDVTERKRQERAIRETTERFRTIFDESSIAIELYSAEGVLVEANRASLELFGVNSIKDVSGFKLFQDPNISEAMKSMLLKGETIRYEVPYDFEMVRKDGAYPTSKTGVIYLDVLITPLVSGGGYLVQSQDMTKRKLMEDEVRFKSEEALARAQRIAHLGSWEWDIPANRVNWSAELHEIFGTEPNTMGATFESSMAFVHPDEREAVEEAVREAISGGRRFAVEFRAVLKGGAERVLYAEADVSFDTKGNPINMTGIAQDITERKKAEDELRMMMSEIESSNKELEQFAYIISHDLQEPLRMVASYMQLLEGRYRGRLDESADTFIDYAVDGAKRMSAMINDILAYSRVGTHGRPLAEVDCEGVCSKALANLSLSISENRAEISRGPLPRVFADEAQLTRVIQNLVENAIKFRRPEERPLVEIGARLEKNEWVFSVKDNGIGIEKEFSDRIFLIFQRLHGVRYKGTGMGLSICKKIVERHGGRIWVESRPGEGSTFYFTIPVKKAMSDVKRVA